MSFLVLCKVLKYKILTTITNLFNDTKVRRKDTSKKNSIIDLVDHPTYIIDNIYLGNAYNAADYKNIDSLEIKYIVNVTDDIPDFYPIRYVYHTIKVKDVHSADLKPFMSDALDFLMRHSSKNEKILIHCYMGSSRSATICALYLIFKHNMTVDSAISFLEERRPIVNMNVEFIRQLKEFVRETLKRV